MSGRYDSDRYPVQGSYRSSRPYSSQSLPYRSRPRDDTGYTSRRDRSIPPTPNDGRRRSYPPRAFIEDEDEASKKEYNPSETLVDADEEGAKYRGEVNQVPLLVPVPENNPERRFVLLPKSGGGPHPEAASHADSADGTTSGKAAPTDKTGEYEANTCRKFTVPRIDPDSIASGGTTSSSATKVAAASAAGLAPAGAAAASNSKRPPLERRKSRNDLPRIETDVEYDRRSDSRRPSSATHSDHRSSDRSRHKDHDRNGSRDNEFLSPAIIKHATKGRDRTYFDSKSESPSTRSTSSGRRVPQDDKRGHDRSDRHGSSAEVPHRRRSSSFYEPEKSARRPSIRQASRGDSGPSPRGSRTSLSPPGKGRRNQSPSRHSKRTSPPRERDHDRERERDRDRERDHDRDRDRGRDRDHPRVGRRGSVYRKRHDSPSRADDGYSSDERAKSTFSASPLRRQYSDQRQPVRRDDDARSTVSVGNGDTHRPPAPSSTSGVSNVGSGRYKTSGGSPVVHSARQSQAHIPLVASAVPAGILAASAISSASRNHTDRRSRRDSSSSESSSSGSYTRRSDIGHPRGPRARSRAPSIVHNAASDLHSTPPPIQPPLQSRASTLPMPIPVSGTAPIPIPARGAGSLRGREGSRYGRSGSPVDMQRVRSSQTALPRSSGFFDETAASAPTSRSYHPPAFYVNIPGANQTDSYQTAGNHPGYPEGQLPERPAFNRPPPTRSFEGVDDLALVPTYSQYCEDIWSGRIQGLPECPRQDFSNRYNDWRTLAPFTNFFVCPTCYEAAFARTPYFNEFVPAVIYNRQERVRCTFGSLHWYRVAYFVNKKLQLPSLTLLRNMFQRDEELPAPCTKDRPVPSNWYTIIDPTTGKPVPNFCLCEQCVTAIETLFPRLKGIFQKHLPYGYDTVAHCALFYKQGRKRLWKYIGVLESANVAAIASNSTGNAMAIAQKIAQIQTTDECGKDTPLRGRKWYTMRSIPECVVCEECFEDFVFPMVNTYRTVAGDFFKETKVLPVSQCHLYTPRMRNIFMTACQLNDKIFLQEKLEERNQVINDITDQLELLDPEDPSYEEAKRRLVAEYRKYE